MAASPMWQWWAMVSLPQGKTLQQHTPHPMPPEHLLLLSLQTLSLEAPARIKNKAPPPDWPQEGEVTFENAEMRYRENLPLVLKKVSFTIKPKEKIGIVGRTGSGTACLGHANLWLGIEPVIGMGRLPSSSCLLNRCPISAFSHKPPPKPVFEVSFLTTVSDITCFPSL